MRLLSYKLLSSTLSASACFLQPSPDCHNCPSINARHLPFPQSLKHSMTSQSPPRMRHPRRCLTASIRFLWAPRSLTGCVMGQTYFNVPAWLLYVTIGGRVSSEER